MSRNCNLLLQPAHDDTVQCLFFSSKVGNDLNAWEELCYELNNYINTLSKGYIWHREEFKVNVPLRTNNEDRDYFLCYLSSVTSFGDNLEDEWFILYIVLEISKQFPHLLIQIKDNDGDFMLIEAANCLQSWIKPENTDNRVFIYDHHIHIITPELAALEPKISIEEAFNIVIKNPEKTKASNDIQEAVLKRIGNYPDKILENIHRAMVTLPSELAAVLTLIPTLIAPIVDAYCNHDVIDAKLCKNINFNDCITVEVKFTKFLYAMLVHSKLVNCGQHYTTREIDKKTRLGLKLTCGYQIIMGRNSENDIFSSKEYQNFLNSLNANGYFKDNIKGSAQYNDLLNKAKQYFSNIESPINSKVSSIILNLTRSSDFMSVKDRLKCSSVEQVQCEDDENWLNINPEQLNELLQTRYGKQLSFKSNDIISSQAITEKLSSFLNQTSDFEGIEPNYQGAEHSETEDDKIEFESDQFISCIEKMLDIISVGDNLESDEVDSDDELQSMHFNENEDSDDDCDIELKSKLEQDPAEDLKNSKTLFGNIIQSIKEEKASTGPSSNLMSCLGVNKTDLLDSDDD